MTRNLLNVKLQKADDNRPDDISVVINSNGESVDIAFQDISRKPIGLKWSPEVQISMGIMPAMSKGQTLFVDGLPETVFLSNMKEAQELWKCWFPGWSTVSIETAKQIEPKLPDVSASGVGLFLAEAWTHSLVICNIRMK
jgi:hypothetical protein